MSMKNPLTLAGIEPATFRFVAQHLNHCATAVPIWYVYLLYYPSQFSTKHGRPKCFSCFAHFESLHPFYFITFTGKLTDISIQILSTNSLKINLILIRKIRLTEEHLHLSQDSDYKQLRAESISRLGKIPFQP